jgi:hypothetical protein
MHPVIANLKTWASGALLALLAGSAWGQLQTPNPRILTLTPEGVPFHLSNYWISEVSGSGRFVVHLTEPLLPLGDINPPGCCTAQQVLLFDTVANVRRVVSVNAAGIGQDASMPFNSWLGVALSVSDDGRRVVFNSRASNLSQGLQPNTTHCFLWDRELGYAQVLDIDPDPGVQRAHCASLSADGRTVVGLCLQQLGAQEGWTVCSRDLESGAISLEAPDYFASLGSRFQLPLELSADASTIAFSGRRHDEPPSMTVVRRLDRRTGEVAAITPGAPIALSVSGDGRYIAIQDVVARRYDHATGTTQVASRVPPLTVNSRPTYDIDMSRDGRYVVFRTRAPEFAISLGIWPSDVMRVYRVDVFTGEVVLVSRLGLDGPAALRNGDDCDILFGLQCDPAQMTPRISGNGRYVAFRHDLDVLGPSYPVPPNPQFAGQLFYKDLGPTSSLGTEPTPVSGPGALALSILGLLIALATFRARRSA